MDNSLYHNMICGTKAVYPRKRDSPLVRYSVIKVFNHNLTENDITEIKRIFYGGKTHADCYFCEEAHHTGR